MPVVLKSVKNNDEWERGKPIKAGMFAEIHVVKRLRDNKLAALKKPTRSPAAHCGEVLLTQDLGKPGSQFLVRVLDVVKKEADANDTVNKRLVLELCNCDLGDALGRNSSPPSGALTEMSRQMWHGIAYLHSKNVTHGDFKLDNVLVDCASGTLKLCDLGMAKRRGVDEKFATYEEVGEVSRSLVEHFVRRGEVDEEKDALNCEQKIVRSSQLCRQAKRPDLREAIAWFYETDAEHSYLSYIRKNPDFWRHVVKAPVADLVLAVAKWQLRQPPQHYAQISENLAEIFTHALGFHGVAGLDAARLSTMLDRESSRNDRHACYTYLSSIRQAK